MGEAQSKDSPSVISYVTKSKECINGKCRVLRDDARTYICDAQDRCMITNNPRKDLMELLDESSSDDDERYDQLIEIKEKKKEKKIRERKKMLIEKALKGNIKKMSTDELARSVQILRYIMAELS